MKKYLLSIALFVFVLNVFSQNSSLIIFSDQGESFYLIVNGLKQNANPETNVKVTGLNAEMYKVKIIFKDSNIKDMDKNIYFHTRGNEYTYTIKKNKKGKYKLRYRGDVPNAQVNEMSQQQQTVIVFSTTPPVPQAVTQTQSTTTTITTNQGNVSQGVSMGVNVNEQNGSVNMNINIHEGGVHPNGNVTYSETTTSTITTTNSNVNENELNDPSIYLPGYYGPVGCTMPMLPNDFAIAKKTIMEQSFSDSKLMIAKQIASSNCLLSSQVKELIMLFDFEDTKLEFAKYCYGYTFDLGNYFQINSAFDFESTIEELNNYINQIK